MNITEFSQWAKKASSYCSQLIKDEKSDLYFYAFQSSPIMDKRPEVLILGINPGVDGGDDGKYKDFEKLDEHDILARFSKGNPFFVDRHKWRLWQGLKRVFNAGNMVHHLNDESSFLYMNILYFNTHNVEEFLKQDKGGKIFNECVKLTAEFIHLLQPKRILCLSIDQSFNRLSNNIQDREDIIPSYLSRGVWNNIPIYGIRHTSRFNPYEQSVGKALEMLFNDKDIPKEVLLDAIKGDLCLLNQPAVKLKVEELKIIADRVRQRICEKYSVKINPHKTDSILCANDRLYITITHTNSGYIAIRHSNFNGKFTYSNKDNSYNYTKELQDGLSKYEFNSSDVWLGQKSFKRYLNNSVEIDAVCDKIINELSDILPLLNSTPLMK